MDFLKNIHKLMESFHSHHEAVRLDTKLPQVHHPHLVEKSWGYELWIHNSYLYCGKFLVYTKKTKSSFHFHLKKTETFICAEGKFKLMTRNPVTAEENIRIIEPGMCVHLNPGVAHQIESLEDFSVLIEFSTQHFDEDSVRIFPSK